jgi:Tol biopolymer transport system component
VTIEFAVTNIGDLTGTYEVELYVDGEIENTIPVSLDGGSSETITFTTSRDVTGTYNTLPPLPPAEFQISNLTIRPSEVEAGTEVVVSLDVANTGGSEGTYTAILEINGDIEETKNITVAAGITETVSYQLTEDTPGMYAVSLDGLTATLKVGVELIAFVSDRDGDWEIYVMNPDGSNVVQLTNNTAWDRNPSWSPDGSRIAFASNRDGDVEIYVMNPGGSNVTQLTNSSAWDGNPSWSPDGSKIVFASNRNGYGEIYVMNSDGSNVVQLTDIITDVNVHNESPLWSPDGSKIAFLSNRDGNGEIYMIDADGSNLQRLTDNPAADWGISWSPDGSKIVFNSDRDGDLEIYVMNPDGSNIVKLTNNTVSDERPLWSPDGQKIIFVSDRDGNLEIYIMNSDGSNAVRLTNSTALDLTSSWGLT